MRILLLLSFLLITSLGLVAQTIQFKTKTLHPVRNIETIDWEVLQKNAPAYKGRWYVLIQFAETPGVEEKKMLLQHGVDLLDYVPQLAYTSVINGPVSPAILHQAKVRWIGILPVAVKVEPALWKGNIPKHANKQPGTVDVFISINKHLAVAELLSELFRAGIKILNSELQNYNIIEARIAVEKLQEIAAIPFIQYLQPVPPPDAPLNDDVRSNHKANLLQAPVSAGGEDLQGRNVVIGIGDNADLKTHVDIADRVIDHAPFLPGNHGVHVAGTAAGAGIIDPLYKGVAPKAHLLAQVFSGIFKNAGPYVSAYGMVVTNNSYGSISGECDYAGTYDLYSTVLDQQAFQYPELLHVFAAGNDGPNNIQCPFNGYRTLLGGYQSSKNVLTVGWGEKDMTVSNSGSWGPASDGRIKPEIIATGGEVRSTAANNSYLTDWGSSMASPAVAGGAALLIEKYRQMHSGSNPASGLVKALLVNGANDMETPGPDHKSGFGWMNLERSVEMIKHNRYFMGNVVQAGANEHTINIPANATQMKVLLYWHDPAAAVFAEKTLVNDLDVELVDPSGNVVLPWRLDTADVSLAATRAVDRWNNIEQVTLINPLPGNYIIRVKGTAINVQPAQEYALVYDVMTAGIEVSFPATSEPLVPNENVWINWDAWDISTSDFTIEFSADNGATWSVINSSVPAGKSNFQWTVPNVAATAALIRVTRNGQSITGVSSPFAIMPQPVITLATNQCPTYASLEWTTIPGATAYDVMMKSGPDMVVVATSNTTTHVINGLSADSTYWFSVRPVMNAVSGRRAVAIGYRPNLGNCTGNISNLDLAMDSIISPNSGRKFTSTEITTSELVIRVKNLDDAPVTGFDVKYSINGGAFVTETVSATIPAQGFYTHTFTGVDFSNTGTYHIVAVVSKTGDPVAANDTVRKTIQHLPNPRITQYIESFDSAPAFEVQGSRMGLPGLPHWDLQTTAPTGRARSFVQQGFGLNDDKALTLDMSTYSAAGNTNYLVGTFNLADSTWVFPDEVGQSFDFWFKHHGAIPSADNRVWARRSDTSAWIQVYDLDSAATQPAGEWKYSGVIYLWKYIDLPGTSTQIRIGQSGVAGVADNDGFIGLTIDSFRLYQNPNDFGIVRIISPVQKGCALGNAETLTIETTGSRSIPSNVPVSYRVNGGPVITEQFFGGIGPYSFNTKLDLSAPGTYEIDVWIDHFADNVRTNDSIIKYTLVNQPLVNSFPYLENFENGAGHWFAEGRNSSWQLGKPESIKINKAASGNNAWKTSLRGSYNDNELSYLYSPCFNTSALTTPYLSFSVAMDIEQCEQFVCDAAWVEYSLDGASWSKLGSFGDGANWYNNTNDHVWDSAGFKRWHVASVPVPASQKVQFRFVMYSDASLIKEGIAIDDIHVYDRMPIYRPVIDNFVTAVQNVSGNEFIHLRYNGQLIASINPLGNNLGTTEAGAFIHVSNGFDVRHINNQYYHHRNITIKPAQTSHADSSIVRFYFTDAETDTLTRASGCTTCAKPKDAYELGVTKYDDADDSRENWTLADNLSGTYSFIANNDVKIVPYDIGYYAEFRVKDFSEFWLNNGGANNHHLLPLQLKMFTATQKDNDVLLQWTALNESNVSHYEVQVAKGNEANAAGRFETIGNVSARNIATTNYDWLDDEAGKTGVRYYRLKLVDKDGTIIYSEVRHVVFSAKENWMVYPNPANGVLNIVTQAQAGLKVEMQLMNATGQVVWQRSSIASGQQERIQAELAKTRIAAGVYMLKILAGEEVKFVKVVLQ